MAGLRDELRGGGRRGARPAGPGGAGRTGTGPRPALRARLRRPAAGGAETVSPALLRQSWAELIEAPAERGRATEGGAGVRLRQQNEHWNPVGRVWRHRAENRCAPERPFAFLATYVDRTTGKAEPVHRPLGQAQTVFAGRGPAQVC